MRRGRLKKILSDYKEKTSPKNNTIGSIFKHYRLESGYTLEEVSQGNCSVSYLCKVENNQLIPSENILGKIVSKLKLEDKIYNQKINKKPYINEILLKGTVEKILLKEVENENDYKSKLIRLANYIMNDCNINKANHIAKDIFQYYIFFSEDEMSFYLYLLMKLNYLNENYYDVVALYEDTLLFSENELIKIYMKKTTLKSLYRLKLFKEARSLYEEISVELYKLNFKQEIEEINEYELSSLARVINKDELLNKLVTFNNLKIKTDLIWYNHYFYYEKNFLKALEHIELIKHLNDEYLVYYLICLERLNLQNRLIDEIKNIEYKDENSYGLIIEYFKERYLPTENKKPLREAISKIELKTDDTFVLKYILESVINELSNKYLYKEAFELSKKIIKLYKKRESIMTLS